MRADFCTLFQHHDGEVRIDLLQPDRGRKPSRSGADDHDIELHRFTFRQFHFFRHKILVGSPVPSGFSLFLPYTTAQPRTREKTSSQQAVRVIVLGKAKALCRDQSPASATITIKLSDNLMTKLLLRARNNENRSGARRRQEKKVG